MMKIKVLIVDDHMYIREGLKLILETGEQYEVAGEAEDGIVALAMLDTMRPDLILLDLNMPRMGGLEVMEALQARGWTGPVIVLTTYNEDELMLRALELGARGYLLKDTGREALFRTLESALRGETLLQPEIIERVLQAQRKQPPHSQGKEEEQPVLSEKEKQVLLSVAQGLRSKEIASEMGIAERTVKAHLTNIYNKLGVDTRSQAVAAALERGIIRL